MSTATLAPSRTLLSPAQPDRIRITALSAALAVNLGVLLFASRPLPPMPLAFVPAAPALATRFIPRPRPVIPPPPPVDPAPLHAPRHSTPAALPRPAPPAVAPVEAGHTVAPPIDVTPTRAPDTLAPPGVDGDSGSGEASLAYRSAPLHYPTAAIRQHLHGTVILRVRVDAQGRPVEVQVERSSGHPLLDRSAREQVLAGWRFEPTQVDGHPVGAWARVPVQFELQRL